MKKEIAISFVILFLVASISFVMAAGSSSGSPQGITTQSSDANTSSPATTPPNPTYGGTRVQAIDCETANSLNTRIKCRIENKGNIP